MAIPHPLRIFHITAIPNLPRIVKSEMLLSNRLLQKRNIAHANIAYQNAQGKRATKLVAKPPAGVIHDYVPFYFAPRSPMLMAVNEGRVEGCPHRQEDIAHLATTVDAIVAANLPYVFYDYNATLSIATCYNDLEDLDKIDWKLFHESPRLDGYCKYWHSRMDDPKYVRRMETRQAEFLVHGRVPLNVIESVGVYDAAKAEQVRTIFDEAGFDLPVEVKSAWYY